MRVGQKQAVQNSLIYVNDPPILLSLGCYKNKCSKTFLLSAPWRYKEKCYQPSRFFTEALCGRREEGKVIHTPLPLFRFGGIKRIHIHYRNYFGLHYQLVKRDWSAFTFPTWLAVDLNRAPHWWRSAHQSGVCWKWQSDKLGLYLLCYYQGYFYHPFDVLIVLPEENYANKLLIKSRAVVPTEQYADFLIWMDLSQAVAFGCMDIHSGQLCACAHLPERTRGAGIHVPLSEIRTPTFESSGHTVPTHLGRPTTDSSDWVWGLKKAIQNFPQTLWIPKLSLEFLYMAYKALQRWNKLYCIKNQRPKKQHFVLQPEPWLAECISPAGSLRP